MAKKAKGNNRTRTMIIAAILILFGAGLLGVVMLKNMARPLEFQKGVVYVSWSKEGYLDADSDKSLEALKATGATWVNILLTWYQQNCQSTEIQKTNLSPSTETLAHAIRKAHELGLKVMLKPHVDLLNESDGSWRGEIGCTNEADWDKWFKSYTDYMMYCADLAKKEKAEMICIGTELTTAATTKGYMWRDMIKKIRGNYSGLLTYAAHWDEYPDVRFWDLLDYVGIDAYFPISEKMNPSYDEIKTAWEKWAGEIEEFQKKVNKPVIFPETGCNSCDGALIRPWEHNPRREVNLALQENDYKIINEIFSAKPWFYGQYWWYWGTNAKMGGPYNTGFTPQNKPAEQAIKDGYAKPIVRPAHYGG